MPRTPVNSWPCTLTEWCVIRAFERAGCPGCLRKPPALAAAFVTEVSEVIRFRTFAVRTVELIGLRQAAEESAYEAFGGDTYRTLRKAAAEAENDYLVTITATSRCERRLVHRERCDTALAVCRHRFAAEAAAAQHRCARTYWAAQRRQWLQSDLFAHLDCDSPILRLAEITPVWWAMFVRCLQTEFSRRDLTCFHLLEELPRLRQQARKNRKKVLAGLVEEWRAAHADKLGLPARLHYHVIEPRGMDRARFAQVWFKSRWPADRGCLTNREARRSALACLPSAPERDWTVN